MLGDAAFEKSYAELRPALLRFVRARVRDGHLARDLVQEVYEKALRHRARFDPSRPLRAWIYAIARNACIDHLRRRGRDPLADAGQAAPGDPPDLDALAGGAFADPHDAAERTELVERARAHLEGLPDRRRAAFEMRVLEGFTYREVSEALGVPLGTVAWWVRETLIALADRLEDA